MIVCTLSVVRHGGQKRISEVRGLKHKVGNTVLLDKYYPTANQSIVQCHIVLNRKQS